MKLFQIPQNRPKFKVGQKVSSKYEKLTILDICLDEFGQGWYICEDKRGRKTNGYWDVVESQFS